LTQIDLYLSLSRCRKKGDASSGLCLFPRFIDKIFCLPSYLLLRKLIHYSIIQGDRKIVIFLTSAESDTFPQAIAVKCGKDAFRNTFFSTSD